MFEHAHCMRQINPAKDRAPVSVRSTSKKKDARRKRRATGEPARGEQGGIRANNVWPCSIPVRRKQSSPGFRCLRRFILNRPVARAG